MRRWLGHVGAVLFLVVLLAVSVDWLASAVGADMSTAVDSWWGARQGSPWDPGSAENQAKLRSIDLLIKITGDQFSAEYTVTAPAKTSLAADILSAGSGDTGNYFVNNVLGNVSIAEFRYGLTGWHYVPVSLTFHGPELTVGKDATTAVVSSDPVRLYLHRQLITIMPPAGTAAGVPEQIQIRAPAVQVLAMSGVRLDGVAKDEADLHRGATLTDITVSAGGDSGLDWLAGLRGLGGVTIPVVDGLFSRLGNLFDYAVLLWALVIIRFALPYSRLAEVSRNIVFTIIAAMGAVAFLAFLIDLGTTLFHSLNPRGEAAAGPVALLVAGAGLVWPVACFGTGRDRRPRHRPLARPYVVWFTCAIYGLVLFEYWVILYVGMHINLLTNVHAFTGTVLVTALVWLLVRKLLGTIGLAPALVSAGVLIVALGATIIWPVLYFSSWGPAWDNYIAHVNVWGKWIFLAVAVLTVLGLGLLVFRAVQALPIARPWRITLTLAITVMITAIVLPDAITNAQLAEPHGSSLAPINLIGLFDTLPLLVDWLLLALAIAVAMSLPAKSAARPLARRIVIPIALLLLFWNDKWLYLPVTLIIGLILLSRLVFPRRLAEVPPYTQTSAEAIDESIASWRQADFVARQRQALTSGTGLLADLIQNQNSDYTKRIESLTEIQDQLACERDRLQSNARKLEAVAFEQRGWVPDRCTAVSGAVLGAILGVVPSLITILTTKPSVSSSGYPVLNFFGGTAVSLRKSCERAC